VWWVKCKKRVNQNSIKEKLKQNFTISASNERFIFLWANVFNRFKYFTVLIISTKFVQCSNWTVQNSCVFNNSTLPCSKPSPLLSLLLVLPKPIAQTDAAGTELVPMAMA